MQIFSRTLAQLYEAAEHHAPDRFPARALRLLLPLIRFDGAILDIGKGDTVYCGEPCAQEQTPEPGETVCAGRAQGPQDHPLAAALALGLRQPWQCDCETLQGERRLHRLGHFARKHGLRKLLLYGDLPDLTDCPRWLALFRASTDDFSTTDVEYLKAVWPHVSQAITMNLRNALNQLDPLRARRALALINSHGIIEAADQGMTELLKREWPGFEGACLPDEAMKELVAGNCFRGKRIELSTFYKFGYMVCAAAPASGNSNLTPSEMRVATRFASGMTYSEIASQLGISPHTVRNQLAQIYQKLGIHSKAELARLLARS